jgi:hypothetical protein
MLRKLTIVCLCLFGMFCKAQTPLIEKDALLAMARSGDIEGLETAFCTAHELNIAGDITADELRNSVSWLTVTDPQILETSFNWQEVMPESPYAATTVSWQLYQMGWSMRGEAMYYDVNEEAMTQFYAMHSEALRLALQSYEAAPDYIAASDALISLQKTTKLFPNDIKIVEFLSEVMEKQPNLGTVMRAADLAAPSWGGGGHGYLEILCRHFLGGITRFGGKSELEWLTFDACHPTLVITSGLTDDALDCAIRKDILFDPESHMITRLWAIAHSGNQQRSEELIDFLWADEDKGFLAINLAKTYYRNFHVTEGEQDELNAFIADRVMRWAPDLLIDDPFNLSALALLEGDHTPWFDGTPYWMSPEKNRIINGRRLMMAPYQAEWWVNLAESFNDIYDTVIPLHVEQMFANAIVYGSYDPEILDRYTRTRWIAHNRFVGHAQNYYQTEAAQKSDYLDVAPMMLCPVVRVIRLQEILCEADPVGYVEHCNAIENPRHEVAHLLDAADFLNMCAPERTGSWSEQSFWSIEVDVAPYTDFDFSNTQASVQARTF